MNKYDKKIAGNFQKENVNDTFIVNSNL